MSRGPDAATLLDRALRRDAAEAAVTIAVRSADWVRWASATFTGARHELVLELGGDAAPDWLDSLPERDLPLRGHLVAEIVVMECCTEGATRIARIEALTVEDR